MSQKMTASYVLKLPVSKMRVCEVTLLLINLISHSSNNSNFSLEIETQRFASKLAI